MLLQSGCLSLASFSPYLFSVSVVFHGLYNDAQVRSLTVIVAPFLPPSNGVGDAPPLPYYMCVTSLIHFLHPELSDK